MKYGFIKVASCAPQIKVADTNFNADNIITAISTANKAGAELIVFPEMSLTGATCADLIYSQSLLVGAVEGLKKVLQYTVGVKALIFIGMPYKKGNVIYDVAVAVNNGKVIGIVPKTVLYAHDGYNATRYFAECPVENQTITFMGKEVPFGNKIIFTDIDNSLFSVGVEIGADLLSPLPPSIYHTLNGALVVANLSATPETVCGEQNRLALIKDHSQKTVCAYVYAGAGDGESTTDGVYAGHRIIAENGQILESSALFNSGITVADVDLSLLDFKRSKSFTCENRCDGYETVYFSANRLVDNVNRAFIKTPFAPEKDMSARAERILDIQAEGLKKRLAHTNASSAVVGLSGGLDSTLAILVTAAAMKKLGRPASDIIAITMPCFGTTSRTLDNSIKLAKALKVTLKKIDITKSVKRHLKDIKHEDGVYDAAYENAQARERTQVLMDVANMNNGIVIGTGDLSELALGWATYNGDHMSMYAVNASVPKTLVRCIVDWYTKKSKGKLKAVLTDILDTPVSPELLPTENDAIAQKTEDIVGPYILHDFFLYNMLQHGYSPKKLYFVATKAFKGDFREETILKWLKIFVKRFFSQQFKRSCLPDGVKVGSVALSPRGDWQMPSDAVCALWLNELEEIK